MLSKCNIFFCRRQLHSGQLLLFRKRLPAIFCRYCAWFRKFKNLPREYYFHHQCRNRPHFAVKWRRFTWEHLTKWWVYGICSNLMITSYCADRWELGWERRKNPTQGGALPPKLRKIPPNPPPSPPSLPPRPPNPRLNLALNSAVVL